MLDDVGSNLKTVKFFVQHFGCCMMLYLFGHVHTTLLDLAGDDVVSAVLPAGVVLVCCLECFGCSDFLPVSVAFRCCLTPLEFGFF